MIYKDEFWDRLVDANTSYRLGESKLSDEVYDNLIEKYASIYGVDVLDIASKLMDLPGKVKHSFVCGSMRKLKASSGELSKWLETLTDKSIVASAKVDGMSIVVEYNNGEYVRATTRGDGTFGQNQTDKCRLILPNTLETPFTGIIRGELTLTYETFKELSTLDTTREHKNTRNSTVGIINRVGDVDPTLTKLVKFVGYEIVGSEKSRLDQINYIKDTLMLDVPKLYVIDIEDITDDSVLSDIYKDATDKSDYMIDGLVIHGKSWSGEPDEYYPTKARAFKVNSDGESTTVLGITWNVGKTRKMTPVINIEPIQLAGTTVSNVTGNNATYLIENGIGIGAVVDVIKSGEIIPKVVNVAVPVDVVLDDVKCPECGNVAVWDENHTHLMCDNQNCIGVMIGQVESFLISLNVPGAKYKTLEKRGIHNFNDLINFKPGSSKVDKSLYTNINEIVFGTERTDLLAALTWIGSGKTNFEKIFAMYSFDEFDRLITSGDIFKYPAGISQITIDNIRKDWTSNVSIVNSIMSDSRYNVKPNEVINTVASDKLAGKSFCFSGKFNTPRKTLVGLVGDNGGDVLSVSKKLQYFVRGGDCGPSKLDKVNKLGVTIISEDDFLDML